MTDTAAPQEVDSIFGCAVAAVLRLQSVLDRGVDVDTHGGTFDLQALSQFMVRAPAVRVAVVGVDKPRLINTGQVAFPVRLAAAVVTQNAVKLPCEVSAATLATAVMLALNGSTLGLSNGYLIVDAAARNEYSGRVSDKGIALWQVTWTQVLQLGDETDDFDPCTPLATSLSSLVVFGTGLDPTDGLVLTGDVTSGDAP